MNIRNENALGRIKKLKWSLQVGDIIQLGNRLAMKIKEKSTVDLFSLEFS